ncbi:hypothetical protein EJB05_31493, partial [Eragrostis curvula]
MSDLSRTVHEKQLPSEEQPAPTPVINLGHLSLLDSTTRSRVIDDIAKACRDLGYFQVINHGINQSVMDNAVKAASAFFKLPNETKEDGHVPRAMGRLQDLQRLYLFQNDLEADENDGWEFITSLSNCSQLQELDFGNNSFTGKLPSSIGNISTTIQVLHLEDNGISGTIPSTIGNLVSLRMLGLGGTSISGMVPDSIGELGNLGQLGLYNTYLSGLIPSSLANLSKLKELFAQNANLEGTIPASLLGMLENLIALALSNNPLNGSIPPEIFKLPPLSKFLDLSYNALSGPIPSEVGRLRNINNMDLSGNQLSRELRERIGECIMLQGRWLDNNLLEGNLPQSLKNIKEAIGTIYSLKQLNLAHNNLSGPIPTLLQNLTSLTELDSSFNNLQGEVPEEGIFRNLAKLSITANKELCGGIPQLHLAPCPKNPMKKDKKKMKSLTIALATTGALLSLAFVIALIQLIYKKLRKRHNLSTVEMADEIRVWHRCVIKIMTCCSIIDHQGQEFEALVFEFMPNGSLNDWLHPKSELPTLNKYSKPKIETRYCC